MGDKFKIGDWVAISGHGPYEIDNTNSGWIYLRVGDQLSGRIRPEWCTVAERPWEPADGTFWRDIQDDLWAADEDGAYLVGRDNGESVQRGFASLWRARGPMREVKLVPADVDLPQLVALAYDAAYKEVAALPGGTDQPKLWAKEPEKSRVALIVAVKTVLEEVGLGARDGQ